jgi:hypothetical protein
MSYQIRFVTRQPDLLPFTALEGYLQQVLPEHYDIAADDPQNWQEVVIATPQGEVLLGLSWAEADGDDEERASLRDKALELKPANAAEWVAEFLEEATYIYRLELEDALWDDSHEAVLDEVLDFLFEEVGGILYADAEGFTNEDSEYILLEPDIGDEDPIQAAVLDEEGWQSFELDPSDAAQWQAFQQGQRPAAAGSS